MSNLCDTGRLCFLAVLLFLCSGVVAWAQTGQGSISGKVSDPKGHVIVDAQVQVTNVDTGVVQTARTNSSGIYTLVSLNPAVYSVEVGMKGFSTQTVTGVTLQAAGTATIDVTMQVGKESASITVTAEAVLLQKDTSDVTTTVDHELVEALPYPERSSLQAALLVPGVNGDAISPGGIQSENAGVSAEARTTGAGISIGGAAPGTASIMVDGSDVTQGSFPRAGVNLSGMVVQETAVITGGLPAKYGRTSGGSIVQTSKPGTDKYRGALTWRHTDPFFQAFPVGGTIGPNRHENFYGVYLGGPVWIPKLYDGHHKTFFFVAYEPARIRSTVGIRGSFFTPDDLAGRLNNSLVLLDQSVLKSQGYGAALAAPRTTSLYYQAPLNAQGFPTGARYSNSGLYQQIPGNDLSAQVANNPFAKFVLGLMPTPSNPGPYTRFDNANASYAPDGTNGSYVRGVLNTDDRYSIRVDHQLGARDRMFVRYTVIPVKATRFFAVAVDNPLTQSPTDDAYAHNLAMGWTHVVSGSIVNSAHYSYLRVNQVRGIPPSTHSQDYAAQYGLTPATAGYGFPSLGSFGVSGASYAIAPGTNAAATQLDQNFIFGDDVTWSRGRHLFQFGVDLRWIQSNQYNNGGVTGGTYSFAQTLTNNGSTGGAPLASFDLGLIGSYTASPISLPAYYRWRYYAGYFQDDWRVTKSLTLNLGLRYNVETPRMEKFGNQPIVVTNQPNTLNTLPTSAAVCFSEGCPGVGKTLWPVNPWGFEPRIGISYASSPRTTLRAAYALSRLPLTGFFNLPLPDLSGAPTVGGTTGGVTANQVVNYMTNPVAPLVSSYQALKGARGPILFWNAQATPIAVRQNNVVPYTQTWHVTVQYQPEKTTLIQLTYQGLKGTHLLAPVTSAQNGDLNQPSIATMQAQVKAHAALSRTLPCTGTPTPGCGNPYAVPTSPTNPTLIQETALQALNPYQNFFNQVIPDDFNRSGSSIYHGLLLSLNHRAGRNLSLLSSFSWTKVIDNVAETTTANNSLNGASATPQNPFFLEGERSLASFDQPVRFKAGYNLTIPFGYKQRFTTHHRQLDNALGNWSTSGNFTMQTGFPNIVTLGNTGYFTSITPRGLDGCSGTNYCTATALPAGYQLRPKRVRGVPLINPNWKNGGGGVFSTTFVPYLNPAAFAMPGTPDDPQLGDVPRTLGDARSPRETFFDMRVVKAVQVGRYRMNINATFSNVFNHVVYFGLNQTSKSVYTTTQVSTTTGAYAPVVQQAAFGQMTNNSGNLTRVIRIGAELTF